jgi:LCP family protein required for cell wall assembly
VGVHPAGGRAGIVADPVSDRTTPAGRDQRKVFVAAPKAAAPPTTPSRRPPAARPSTAPAPPRKQPPRATPTPAPAARRKRRWPKITLAVALALLIGFIGSYLWALSVFNRIEKVPVSDVLSAQAGGGTNYLIVGSDSRDGIDPNAPDAGAFDDGSALGGQRSDTMLVLRMEKGGAKMLSIPRDLEVQIADDGGVRKINAAYNGGPSRLIRTIQESVGIPIHHYLEVDFVSFAGLVDSLGGITIDFPNPAFDTHSGLNVTTAGPTKLDGHQAIAYVRSRYYTEVIDGKNRRDATGDLGRVQRQQLFLRTVLSKLGRSRNPFALARAASSVSGGLRIDDDLSMLDSVRLGFRLKGLDPIPVELPTVQARDRNGAVLKPGSGFDAAVAQFQ